MTLRVSNHHPPPNGTAWFCPIRPWLWHSWLPTVAKSCKIISACWPIGAHPHSKSAKPCSNMETEYGGTLADSPDLQVINRLVLAVQLQTVTDRMRLQI